MQAPQLRFKLLHVTVHLSLNADVAVYHNEVYLFPCLLPSILCLVWLSFATMTHFHGEMTAHRETNGRKDWMISNQVRSPAMIKASYDTSSSLCICVHLCMCGWVYKKGRKSLVLKSQVLCNKIMISGWKQHLTDLLMEFLGRKDLFRKVEIRDNW